MSLATLKRKTATKYNNMSTNTKNFSLNGTLRNQGYIGQDSLSRTYIRTIAQNGVMHGHGGCCGKFDVSKMLHSTNTLCLNDKNAIKSTVKSTIGYIGDKQTKNHECIVVKADDGHNNSSHWEQIKRIKERAIIKADDPECNPYIDRPSECVKTTPLSRYRIFKGESCPLKKGSMAEKGLSYSVFLNKFHLIQQIR